jgi:hypothetical protein
MMTDKTGGACDEDFHGAFSRSILNWQILLEVRGLIHGGGSADRGDMGKRFIITTNKRGQATLPREVLEHCGLTSGGKLKLEYLPNGVCKFSPIHPRSRAKASQDPPTPSRSV